MVKKSTYGQIVSISLKGPPLQWHVHVFCLTQNMCLQRPGLTAPECQEIAAFAERLLYVGKHVNLDGIIQWDECDQAISNSQEALVAQVFLNISCQFFALELLCNFAIFALKNDVVNTLNSLLLASMPRCQVTSASIDYYKDKIGVSFYPIKFLYTINLAALLLYQLYLKVSYPIIFLYNINPSNGLYNRIHLVVLSVTFRLLRYLILKLQYYSTIIQLRYIPLHTLSSINSIKFIYYQFPIKLIFVITINKA